MIAVLPRVLFGAVLLIAASQSAIPSQAQVPMDGWAFSGVFLALGLIDGNFQFINSTPGGPVEGYVAGDSDGGTGLYTLYYDAVWSYDPSHLPSPFFVQGRLLAPGEAAEAAYPLRDWVYLADPLNSRLTRVRRGIWNQTSIFLASTLAQGISGRLQYICTDGRELFFSVEVTANDAYHIFAMDIQDPAHPIRPLMSLPVGASPRQGATLSMARNGDVLAMDATGLYRIDPVAGVSAQIDTQPFPLSQGWLGLPIHMGYNPWTDTVGITPHAWNSNVPGPPMDILARPVYSNGSWQWVFHYGLAAYGLTALVVQPFELFGIGCPNATGRDPRLGWQGLPREGQSFSITLRDAEPNGFAFFWLGLSDTYWAGVGALPFDAAPFGAPGCLLRVSADVPFPVAVDGNGRASLPQSVPVNPALRGLQVFAQTASSSTANSFGFAASDALIIRLR